MKIFKPNKSQIKHLARHLRPAAETRPEDSLAIVKQDTNYESKITRPWSCQIGASVHKGAKSVFKDNERSQSGEDKAVSSSTGVENSALVARGPDYALPNTSVMFNMYSLNSNGHSDLKRFLEEVGTDPKEARYWLKQFQRAAEPFRPFAVIQVEPDVLYNDELLEQLASCLAFLHRHDMKCVVVHGQPLPQGEEISCDVIRTLRNDLCHDSIRIANMLETQGVLARPLFGSNNILEADTTSKENLQGKVTKVNTELIKWSIGSGHIPIIQSIGESSAGMMVHLNTMDVTASIAKDLCPLKVLFVNSYGGFTTLSDETVANINIPNDLECVYHSKWCTTQQKEFVSYIGTLLNSLPQQSSVVVTSASTILTELFTHHGSGTFFKITEPVHKFSSLKDVDIDRFVALIEKGFGRSLVDEYLENLEDKLHTLYITEGYSTAAVIVKPDNSIPVPYLDKFVVSSAKRGDSMCQMLWDVIGEDFKSIFWRSRNANKINPWYFSRSEGSWTNGEWTVFWYGVHDHRQSSQLIDYALNLESSFIPPPNPAEKPKPESKHYFGK